MASDREGEEGKGEQGTNEGGERGRGSDLSHVSMELNCSWQLGEAKEDLEAVGTLLCLSKYDGVPIGA